jgi:hypothetical protein
MRQFYIRKLHVKPNNGNVKRRNCSSKVLHPIIIFLLQASISQKLKSQKYEGIYSMYKLLAESLHKISEFNKKNIHNKKIWIFFNKVRILNAYENEYSSTCIRFYFVIDLELEKWKLSSYNRVNIKLCWKQLIKVFL